MKRPIKVEILSSPGCSRCARAREELKRVVAEMGADRVQWSEVNVVEQIDYAVQLGVLSTPAIAIDGRLAFRALPSAGRLRQALQRKLNRAVSGC